MTTHTTQQPTTSIDRWGLWETEGLPEDLERQLGVLKVYTPDAISTICELAGHLDDLLDTRPAAAAVDRFLAEPDTWTDRLDRWSTIRILERVTTIRVPPLDWPGWAPPDPHLRRRVLTPVEIGHIRHAALTSKGRTGAIGALDSGAISGELTHITPDSLDTDVATDQATLTLCGTQRQVRSGYPPAAPRDTPVAQWCLRSMTALSRASRADMPLLYGGASSDPKVIQSSILMTVTGVLNDVGLHGDTTAKPMSIRNTFARTIYDCQGLEAAAEALGHDDFMFVAREIGVRPHLPVDRH